MVNKTQTWVEDWVVKYSLCPWAAKMLVGDRMKIHVVVQEAMTNQNQRFQLGDGFGFGSVKNKVRDFSVKKQLYDVAAKLENSSFKKWGTVETALIVVPEYQDFGEFLQLVQEFEESLEKKSLIKKIQVATFHPLYKFQGSKSKDVTNYTNRSPYPTVHLLLRKKVSEAISAYKEADKDTEDIWKNNVELMKKTGLEKVAEIHEKWK